jgi:arsenite methyltransferase
MPMENITRAVSERYARAVTTGEQICCPTGYNFDELRTFIPEEVLKASYGCGTPAGLESVCGGETILDIGSGGGIDCFEASRRVGPTGRVIGIDMTDEMLAVARHNAPIVASNLGYPVSNVEFRNGLAEAMPVEDGCVDLIISNCVINLAPEKPKVFREMFRVLRPGGRFTISDIVSDQPVPNYLVHDAEKWGNCLSGALQVGDYITKMVEAGFLGIHQLKAIPWQVIDGVHFLSITLTGYKLPTPENYRDGYATLTGPFRAVTDELGQTYHRGQPRRIDARTAQLLSAQALQPLFLVSDAPVEMDAQDPRLSAILPEQEPCIWKGDYAMLTGPFKEACDDDQHVFRRGEPTEICSKTLNVLWSDRYRPHFAVINRASTKVSGSEVSCTPDGTCC